MSLILDQPDHRCNTEQIASSSADIWPLAISSTTFCRLQSLHFPPSWGLLRYISHPWSFGHSSERVRLLRSIQHSWISTRRSERTDSSDTQPLPSRWVFFLLTLLYFEFESLVLVYFASETPLNLCAFSCFLYRSSYQYLVNIISPYRPLAFGRV